MKRTNSGSGISLLALLAPASFAAGLPTNDLEEVVVTARLIGRVESSTQGTVTRTQLETRPVLRTGELLETVPGLVVTQHSGDGKANQYFLRGFNLDHGTDLATSADGIPVNMHTHGHGQGYTDINFVIPELLDRIEYKKGTYYADEGNFSAAGAVDLIYRRKFDDSLLSLTVGQDSYARALFAGSDNLGPGDLLWGLEYARTDGPWDLPENLRRVNAVAKYSYGERGDGYSITASLYDGEWIATDQVPERAVDSGALDRFGHVDPTNGGETHRYALNFQIEKSVGDWRFTANAYALDYQLDLFSNFTYFIDPVNGDQFEQFDDRRSYGVHAELGRITQYGLVPGTLRMGVDSRFDDIGRVGLYLTDDRARLSAVREDSVDRFGIGFFIEQQLQLTDWLRAVAGLRHDRADFEVDSDLAVNSGGAQDYITSPKLSLVFGPWAQTEFFVNAGRGFHENDARGTTITVDPADGVTTVDRVRPMVRASGAEIGIRTAIVPHMQFALTAWRLDLDSELIYVGDAGTTEPSRATKRRGVEFAAYFSPLPWLTLDADLAWSHARFSEFEPAGDRIPGAVERVASLGAAVQHPGGWFGGARFRHFGAAPLIENDSVRSDPTTVVNLEVGRHFGKRFTLALAAYNVLDSEDNDITYFYESKLPSELQPVEDRHFHPVEPRTIRLTVETRF
ncbi:MAG TPA: TonB-dependent receptor [Steroidobacteraceae bacterium]|jgi:outer membrane receptor protein involved in Fe transport|nr:TonB-dependent receptor [Steroidobacteraceae bacterium]